MSTAGDLRSGKGHRDENFPVASWLIDARHRGVILAFYEFVRVADDIADHATLGAAEKLAQLCCALAWALMAISFQPILRFYRLSPLWGVALPAISFLFMLYTLDSAYQYAAGKGGSWKGRVQAKVAR